MRILVFLDGLGLGGTEKAATHWALELKRRNHQILILSLNDGPRKKLMEMEGIEVQVIPQDIEKISKTILSFSPQVIHLHAPGFAHDGDILGEALDRLDKKIPVVETNIFGRLENRRSPSWISFRLFISWTSCVQAAQRHYLPLDKKFFERQSVAVYPLEVDNGASADEIFAWRKLCGVSANDILWGRFSRPEPNKWTSLPLKAFENAARLRPNLKLLLQTPPPEVEEQIRKSDLANRFIILPPTSDAKELRLTMSSVDAILHGSSIGESFGYGIAEPMNYGKPAIVHSVPWLDQAQLELVRHEENGLHASTLNGMTAAILRLSDDAILRQKYGAKARAHIRQLADPAESVNRLEQAFHTAISGGINPNLESDLARALETARDLNQHQFGHSLEEQIALRPFYYRVRFSQWRHSLKYKPSLPRAS